MADKKNEQKAVTKSTLSTLQGYFNDEACMRNLKAMLGQKAQGFATSVLSVVNNNTLLQRAEASSIYSSAMVAASLDLPINPNLGFAAIVPYGTKAQFQIMVKGLTQLAIRSNQYAKITNCDVHEGELVKYDPFTDDYVFDVTKRTSDKIIGYMAYFRTVGGFEKYYYLSKEAALKHGKRYSKSFSNGVWASDPDAMGRKTALKMLLSKFGILSIEMQRAIRFDQGVVQGDFSVMEQVSIEDIDEAEVEYVDNPQSDTTEEKNVKVKKVTALFKDFEKAGDNETT